METDEVHVLTLSPDPLPGVLVTEGREGAPDTHRRAPRHRRSRRPGGEARAGPDRRTRRTALVAVVGSLVLLVAVAASVLDHHRLQRTDSAIATTRVQLSRTITATVAARGRLAQAARESGAAAGALGAASFQLAAVQAQLTAAQANIRLDGVSIADLDTCLTGVNQALNEISLGDQAGAAALLRQYEGSCQAAEPPG